jgi:hypothetical protein
MQCQPHEHRLQCAAPQADASAALNSAWMYIVAVMEALLFEPAGSVVQAALLQQGLLARLLEQTLQLSERMAQQPRSANAQGTPSNDFQLSRLLNLLSTWIIKLTLNNGADKQAVQPQVAQVPDLKGRLCALMRHCMTAEQEDKRAGKGSYSAAVDSTRAVAICNVACTEALTAEGELAGMHLVTSCSCYFGAAAAGLLQCAGVPSWLV